MNDGTRTTVLKGAANQMMRLLLSDLDGLRAQIARDAEEARSRREAIRKTMAEAERGAREHIAKFFPEDEGERVRRVARTVLADVPPPGSPAGTPDSFDSAKKEWLGLLDAAQRVGEILIERAVWEGRILKRQASMPVVSSELWSAVDRLSQIHTALPMLRERYVAGALATHAHLHDEAAAESHTRAVALEAAGQRVRERVLEVEAAAGLAAASWSDPLWAESFPARVLRPTIRLGDLEAQLPQSAGVSSVPALVEFPFTAGVAIAAGVERRQAAAELARSLVLRLLAAVPPGQARFVFIDPVSLGQSVAEFRHLAEFDPRLVDVKTWTSERDIEARLQELSDHLEVVISTYLRGQFESIDDYNRLAAEVAEPYRVLVVFDYPEGFSAKASRQLLSLIENGPRCGVHTLLMHGPTVGAFGEPSIERLIHSMQKVDLTGARGRLVLTEPIGAIDLTFIPDASPPITFAGDGQATTHFARLILSAGTRARETHSEPVTLERVFPLINKHIASGRSRYVPQMSASSTGIDPSKPSSWWMGISSAGAYAPIGRAGAQDVAALFFSSTEVAGGAIIVGLPRSGKSTAMHAAILSLSMVYSPEEIELYLIDSKHGVEFKIYEALPHARLVSIRSEREFSASVLQSINREIGRRADVMKRETAGKSNITEYRAATGKAMPRIVVFMDEFHELFEEDDALGHAAFDAFSDIVRQGPAFGVHVVVGSQTLSSMPAMDRGTLSLLPTRVAFMCNEADADLVMGDTNREVKSLSEQGEGILNPSRGEPSHNQPFRGLYVPPDERELILASIGDKAREDGFEGRPRVFDGDTLVPRPRGRGDGSSARPVFRLGEPLSLEPWAGVTLRRGRGGNVVLIGGDDDDAGPDPAVVGAVHSCLADASAEGLGIHVIDFVGDAGLSESLDLVGLCQALGVTYRRGSGLAECLESADAEIARRVGVADYTSPPRLTILHGLHRALDLEPEAPYEEATRTQILSRRLAGVLRDGPEVGVHTIVCVEGLSQFERRLGRDLLKEFDWRVAGRGIRPTDMVALTEAFSEGDVRSSQLLIVDHARGKRRRVRAYPPHTLHSVQAATERTPP